MRHPTEPGANSRYAWYVLGVLCLVYTFNYMDRYLLSILAEDVKKSFSLSDGQLGFLYGTAFAVFYALFGYPIARLADRWRRVNLLAVGLGLWSLMTALSGLSSSLGELALCRAGVGIGEATGSPAGFSLISDWFTKSKRATALGVYIAGNYLGSALSLLLGGLITTRWKHAFPQHPPWGLAGWQVTFLMLGLPGVLLSLWVFTLREPARGLADGAPRPAEDKIWSRFFYDLSSVLPPLTLLEAARAGPRPLMINIAAAIVSVLISGLAIKLTGDPLQWTAIGVGYYAAFSASQSLKHRDRATYALTWGTPTFLLAMIGFGFVSMVTTIITFWTAPLAVRTFGMSSATVGLILGSTTAIGAVLGVLGGGRLSDYLLKYTPTGRIWVGIGSSLIPLPFIVGMCRTHNPTLFFLYFVPVVSIGNAWIGAGAATIQDMVLPRMRGTATNIYFLFSTLAGSGLAPYLVGKGSVATHDLATSVLWSMMIVIPAAAVTLWLCGRSLLRAETSKWERALAAGEAA